MNDHDTNPADNPNLITCPNCDNGMVLIISEEDETTEAEYEECETCQGRGSLHTYYDRYVIKGLRE